jgi:iron(III) transport system ATP-binding protein
VTQLAISAVTKAFSGRTVLDHVDLEVPENSLTAILGPSGSGKTTLLRVIAGFEHADGGTVSLGGTTVDGPGGYLPSERRRIGYVPQEGSLFPHLTVAANAGFGLPRRERRGAAVGDLLDAVGLAGLGGRYPHQLSGGQQQRVALARALAIKPSLVLLDEPFGSLDASLRASVRADVKRLLREAGATAVLVTHDQDEALSTADQVAVLRDGKIAQCAAPQDLYTQPADPELARFVGEANLVDGILGADSVETILGSLPVYSDARAGLSPGRVTVLVRPEQINIAQLGMAATNGITAGNGAAVTNGIAAGNGAVAKNGARGLAGRIVAYGYHGHDAVVHVAPDQEPDSPAIVVRTLGGCDLPAGSPVTLHAHGPVLAWNL